jgi:hypothetical protein
MRVSLQNCSRTDLIAFVTGCVHVDECNRMILWQIRIGIENSNTLVTTIRVIILFGEFATFVYKN